MVGKTAAILLLAACGAAQAPVHGVDEDVETDGAEDATDELPPVTAGVEPGDLRDALVTEARRQLAAMTSSHYVHHTHVDEARGVFDFDCSGFVGYALARSAPDAWAPLASHRRRPLAKDFEAFLAAPIAPWTAVATAAEIRPGDVIAWIEPPENHSRNTGHVVIASESPRPGAHRHELVVTVIDSSHSGHGKADARVREHRNGLGTGELVLHVDETGRAIGYRWSTWAHSRLFHTAIAIGHLP